MKAIGLPPENSLDVAIVIPSYNEGQNVVHMLGSIAEQIGINDLKVGVFVVVNNARDAVSEVLASNETTIDLLLHLQSDLVPDGLSGRNRILRQLKPWNPIGIFASKKLDAERVITSKHQVTLIDMSSDGHAPEMCNVGLARDTGMRLAIPCTKDNGILISTDADTMLGEGYVRRAYDLLSKDRYAAATGPVLLYSHVDQPLRQVQGQTISQAESIISGLIFWWIERNIMYTMKRKKVPGLAGSNTAIKRSEYIAAGGIPHINGAEDTNLGLSLLRQGKKICKDKNLYIFTDARESDRAEAECSMGQHMIARASRYRDDQEGFSVANPAGFVMAHMLSGTVEAANIRNLPEEQWKAMVSNYISIGDFGYLPLSAEELQDLWELKEKEPLLVSLDKNHFLQKYINRLSEKKWQPVSISQCSNMLVDMLMEKEGEDVIECYNKMKIFIRDELRFCRLIREEGVAYPKGKDEWKSATKDEMRALHKIPGSPEEERDMGEILSLMAQMHIASVQYCRQLDEKSDGKIEKAVEAGMITQTEGDLLAKFRSKIQQQRLNAVLIDFQAHIVGQHATIFEKHIQHMSPEVKRAAIVLNKAFYESTNIFAGGWDLGEVEVLKKRIREAGDDEKRHLRDISEMIEEIFDYYHVVATAMSLADNIKFTYYTKGARALLTIKNWLETHLKL